MIPYSVGKLEIIKFNITALYFMPVYLLVIIYYIKLFVLTQMYPKNKEL